MSYSAQTIDSSTVITKGLPLSKNFIIDHLTTGAYHQVFGRIMPVFTPFLKPGQFNAMPNWQEAANLQMGSNHILEDLLFGFGDKLIIQSGWFPGSDGLSMNVQVDGYQNNIYGVASEIAKLAGKAESIIFNYGASSSATIAYKQTSILTNEVSNIMTKDSLNNIVETGITAIRGIF